MCQAQPDLECWQYKALPYIPLKIKGSIDILLVMGRM